MEKRFMKLSDEDLAGASGGYAGPTFVYTFQQGDDLYQLATRYGATVRVLLELHNIQSASQIKPGTRLLIPQR